MTLILKQDENNDSQAPLLHSQDWESQDKMMVTELFEKERK